MADISQFKLEDFRKRLNLCINCGACFYHGPIVPHNWRELPPHEWQSPDKKCPSFEYYQFRSHTALGRLILAVNVWQKDFPIDDDLVEIAYTCTGCGVCNEICQTFLPLYANAAWREEIVERGIALPGELPTIDNNLQDTGNIFGRKMRAAGWENLPPKGENLFFAGCYLNYRYPEIARATVKIMQAAGLEVASLGDEEQCCGFASRWQGNRGLAAKFAGKNVEAAKRAGAKRVVLSCAHGFHMWKNEYPKYVGGLPFEVVHISELIAQMIEDGKIKLGGGIEGKVTFHDPCFLGRHGKVYEQPRKIIKAIPGIELIEMERYGKWSSCCGAGAKVTLNAYPEFAKATAKERLWEAKQAAGTIITSCPTCLDHLRKVNKEENLGLVLEDLVLLTAKSAGIEI